MDINDSAAHSLIDIDTICPYLYLGSLAAAELVYNNYLKLESGHGNEPGSANDSTSTNTSNQAGNISISSQASTIRISFVLSIGCSVFDELAESKQSPVKAHGWTFLSFNNLLDKPEVSLFSFLDVWADWIESCRACGGVLVHCVYGQSRSVSAILYYLMKKCSYELADAIQLVKAKRPKISINPGFLCQLICIAHNSNFGTLVENTKNVFSSNGSTSPSLPMPTPSPSPSPSPIVNRSVGPLDSLLNPSSANDSTAIKCGRCRNVLAYQSFVLPHVHCDELLVKYGDVFWMDYRPIHIKQVAKGLALSSAKLAEKGLIALSPTNWMKIQVQRLVTLSYFRRSSVESVKNSSLQKKLKDGMHNKVGKGDSKDKATGKKRPLVVEAEAVATTKQTKASKSTAIASSKPSSTSNRHFVTDNSNNDSSIGSSSSSTANLVRNEAALFSVAPEVELVCPFCQSAVGFMKQSGLLICGDFLQIDLYALRNSHLC